VMTLADNLRDVVKSIHRDDVLLCAVKSQRGHQREKGGPVFFGLHLVTYRVSQHGKMRLSKWARGGKKFCIPSTRTNRNFFFPIQFLSDPIKVV